MPTKKPQLKTYIKEEYYNKFKEIAEKNNRTISNMLEQLIIKEINEYENKNGNINVKIGRDNNGNINIK